FNRFAATFAFAAEPVQGLTAILIVVPLLSGTEPPVPAELDDTSLQATAAIANADTAATISMPLFERLMFPPSFHPLVFRIHPLLRRPRSSGTGRTANPRFGPSRQPAHVPGPSLG